MNKTNRQTDRTEIDSNLLSVWVGGGGGAEDFVKFSAKKTSGPPFKLCEKFRGPPSDLAKK